MREKTFRWEEHPAKTMVIFSVLGSSAIGGFGIHRLITGDYLLAAFDFVIAFMFLSLGIFTYRTGKDALARASSAAVAAIGPLVFLQMFDTEGIYWVYSSTIVIYYLVPIRQAVVINTLMLIGVGGVFWGVDYSDFQLYSFLVTIGLINGFSFAFALTEERNKALLRSLSLKDDLTDVGNRRAFTEKMTETIGFHKRYGVSACLVCIDIDRFKAINDTLGHAIGDIAIKNLANCITRMLRESDRVFRIGGDEFVIIADGTDRQAAFQLTEKIRKTVEETDIIPGRDLTISLGVTMLKAEDTTDSWLDRADAELYKAKNAGRNRVQMEEAA
ncbi:MAG: GGDEF domain-containing protein [Pseudomonadales bacterium]|nr:GGDEF domain-containing protein [Pseudomonadales bacterium]